jgi:hypothetical protein
MDMFPRTIRLTLTALLVGMLVQLTSVAPAAAEEIDWIREHGLIENATILAAAHAPDGSTVVAGFTLLALPGQMSAGGSDAFVRAYAPDGTERWTRQFGSPGLDIANDVAIGVTGEVYVVGSVGGNALPGETYIGADDAFIRAYHADGTVLWTDQFGTVEDDQAHGVAVTPGGTVYVAGNTYFELGQPGYFGSSDAFLRAYNPAGEQQWTMQFGTEWEDSVTDLATSPDGHVHVVGETSGSLPGFINDGGFAVYIRTFNSDGAEVWTDQFNGSFNTFAAVAVDDAGRIFVAASINVSVPGQPDVQRPDIHLRSYDAEGTLRWERIFGTEALDMATGVRIDADGNIRVEGRTQGNLTGTAAQGGMDGFVRAYDVDGYVLWTEQIDIDAPQPPTWLQTLGLQEGILLHWADNTIIGWGDGDIAGNHVYRSTSGTGPFERLTLEPTPGRSWIDVGAPADTVMYYYVTAVDVRGNQSLPSGVTTGMRAVLESTPEFERTWERTDRPVAEGKVSRTWMWGPEAFTDVLVEEYRDTYTGLRNVQYFDKSRMEDNSFRAWNPWDVTNGLLALELITGHVQLSDSELRWQGHAHINIAGDPGSGPTYAMLERLLFAGTQGEGAPVTDRLHSDGTITWGDEGLAAFGVTGARYIPETMHTIAGPFWDFMRSSGLVYEDGELVEHELFLNPFYATGYPVTEAYWTRVEVGGTPQDVLVQCFERRCLTYTPGNLDGWKVEAGNVGQHYYRWRYGGQAAEPAGQILFAARTGEGFENYEIVLLQTDGSDVTNLTSHPAYDIEPRWSPDGTRILFISDRDGPGLYVMNADGTGVHRVTSVEVENPTASWSPDGQRIAFARDGDIHTIALDGSDLRNLTNSPERDWAPAWSPDGTRIAYTSELPAEEGADRPRETIRMVNVDGSDDHLLTPNPYIARNVAWSPDGERIAFEISQDRMFGYTEAIVDMDPDEPDMFELARCSGYHGCNGFAWSPHSSQVAIARDPTRYDSGDAELLIADAGGFGLRRVMTGDNIRAPAWSPDGQYLAVVLDGEIVLTNLTGSDVRHPANPYLVDGQLAWGP